VVDRAEVLGLNGSSAEGLKERLDRMERLLGLLLSDEAVGNALKGPFRLPDGAQPSRAFQ
jgi:hypothetical protein